MIESSFRDNTKNKHKTQNPMYINVKQLRIKFEAAVQINL